MEKIQWNKTQQLTKSGSCGRYIHKNISNQSIIQDISFQLHCGIDVYEEHHVKNKKNDRYFATGRA